MSVTIRALDDVKAECQRFLARVGLAREALVEEMTASNAYWKREDEAAGRPHHPATPERFTHPCAATGAVKRASLDLTRALADFRK